MRLSSRLLSGGLAAAVLVAAFLYLVLPSPAESRDDAQVAGSQAATESMPDPFVLGFLPSQRAEEILPDARRLASFLEDRLAVKVRIEVPTSYEPLLEGLRFGHVHAAFLDGGPAWIAHRRFGARAVVAEVNEDRTYYWAEAFVREDSPLRSLEDLAGSRVAFTSRTGSSGFIMPVGTLIQEGVIEAGGSDLASLEGALTRTFDATIYAGGYRPALDALLRGRADVAFGAHDAPERFLSEDERRQIRTLHRFGRVPSHAVMVGADLSPEAASRFRDAMLDLNEAGNLPLLAAIYGVDGLRKVETEEHLGEFGRALSALPGMDRTLLERRR